MTGARLTLLAAAVAVVGAGPSAGADDLSPQQRAGKRVYVGGESPSGGEIWGRVGSEGTSVPFSAIPCAGCHGDDGLGRPEGAVAPSDVTWPTLTKPYGITHPSGRKHPPYDEKTLARSISDGIDPAGNSLDWSMPRYSMPAEDMRSLVAYMKRLDSHFDPGISPAAVRVGSVLPLRGRLAEIGQAIQGILESYFSEINAGGGIHGRKLVLETAGYDADAGDGLEVARRLVSEERVLALVSGFLPEREKDLAALAEKERLPFVGPFTPYTPEGGAAGLYVFYPLAGVREQARALAEHAARDLKLEGPRCAVVHAAEEGLADAALAARAQLAARGWKKVEVVRFERGHLDPGLAARLKDRGTRVVLFLGGDADLSALTRKSSAIGFGPYLMVPGVLAGRALLEAPALFRGRIFVAYPSIPSDEKPAAAARLSLLQHRAGLSERHRAAQVSAFTAAAVLAEALRRTGKNLSRERLVKGLEGIFDYDAGLVPRVSFGANRRVGASGAHVVAVDLDRKSFRSVAWRDVN